MFDTQAFAEKAATIAKEKADALAKQELEELQVSRWWWLPWNEGMAPTNDGLKSSGSRQNSIFQLRFVSFRWGGGEHLKNLESPLSQTPFSSAIC